MKKLILFLAFLSLALASKVQAQDFNLAAQNGIAIEAQTGKVLYEKEATNPVPIASLSKILTAYLVYEAIEQGKLSMESQVEISDHAYQLTTNYSISNLPMEKRSYSVKELLEAMLIANANSAAIALAEKVAGSEKDFVDLMKARMEKWGVSDSTLVNASGLNNKILGQHIYPGSKEDEENKMSAYGLALVSYHLITDYPQVLKISQKSQSTFDGWAISNSNYMLKDQAYFRPGVEGLKTSTSQEAGNSFVSTSKEKGMQLITVVLKADKSDTDPFSHFSATADFLDYLTQNFIPTKVLAKGKGLAESKLAVSNGKNNKIQAVANQDLVWIQKLDSDKKVKLEFKAKQGQLEAPIKARQELGQVSYQDPEIIGRGYIEGQGPSVSMLAQKKVERSNFLKIWWNNFVKFVNEKL
ncbi:D-alanyl-D-alanine carboxypeptidase PBP3 [Streptococcus oricebi]|uniref:serine-type D-Ala-D-Ala carboxypeptidase n=1 Tax=Streptococcus oricebi TaxID=1547447 RepID=A0ABS5B5K2_9STRE|nr:D-alanyl-D-alanine carboxypeptidase PBP3 [Streptococcus oricebi]MBP2624089.1 D-alanyl-D-alanine carboxypeptidase [Streptococcus oricebi]